MLSGVTSRLKQVAVDGDPRRNSAKPLRKPTSQFERQIEDEGI